MTNQLVFNNTPLSVTTLNNEIWLSSKELAKALHYSSSKSVTDLYNKYSDEFTPFMSQVVESKTSGNYIKKVRVFSLRGAHLVAMFSRTEIAKEFRKWVLDVLEKESRLTTSPAAIENIPLSAETVNFYDQDIDVIFYNNQPYIIVKQISDNIGLHTETQRLNVRKNKLIKNSICMIKLPCNGGSQNHLCLPLSMLNVWLNSLIASHTKVRESLKLYQEECFNFLFNHFFKNNYKKPMALLPQKTEIEPSYEKLTPSQTRELTRQIHDLSNQFGCNNIANSAIWYALRYVTNTPSPEPFDVRHLPIIVKEYNRIKAIVEKFNHEIQKAERIIAMKIIRRREPIELALTEFNNSINSIVSLSDRKLISALKPCEKLNITDLS